MKKILRTSNILGICISYTVMSCISIIVELLSICVSSSPGIMFLMFILPWVVRTYFCISLWMTYVDAARNKANKAGIIGIQIYIIIYAIIFMLFWAGVAIAAGACGIGIVGYANALGSSLIMTASVLALVCGIAVGMILVCQMALGTSTSFQILTSTWDKSKKVTKKWFMPIKIIIFFHIFLALGLIIHQVVSGISQISLGGLGKIFTVETNLIKLFGIRSNSTAVYVMANISCMFRPAAYFLYWFYTFRLVTDADRLVNKAEIEKTLPQSESETVPLKPVNVNGTENGQDTTKATAKSNTVEAVNKADKSVLHKTVALNVEKCGNITCVEGKDAGISYPIKDGEILVIGKDAALSSIIVNNRYRQVSRRHCSIQYEAKKDSYLVIDYSTNGTFVDDNKLPRGMVAVLPKGSIIRIAKEALKYRLD